MENIKIIKMREEVVEASIDLFIETFSKEPWNDVYESRKQVEEFFKKNFRNNYFLGYVLLVDEEVQGVSLGMKKPWINGWEYYIDQFCIGYNLQRRGLGSRFLEGIEKDIKNERIEGMILNTEKGYPSFEFYRKNGFKALGELTVLVK